MPDLFIVQDRQEQDLRAGVIDGNRCLTLEMGI